MKLNVAILEKERKRRKLAKYTFAKLLGMKPQNYDYILETKQTKLSTIQRIADILLYKPKDLLQ